LSRGSCLILVGKFPSKLAITFQPAPCVLKVEFIVLLNSRRS
jgi:hypothetical protein